MLSLACWYKSVSDADVTEIVAAADLIGKIIAIRAGASIHCVELAGNNTACMLCKLAGKNIGSFSFYMYLCNVIYRPSSRLFTHSRPFSPLSVCCVKINMMRTNVWDRLLSFRVEKCITYFCGHFAKSELGGTTQPASTLPRLRMASRGGGRGDGGGGHRDRRLTIYHWWVLVQQTDTGWSIWSRTSFRWHWNNRCTLV